MSPKPRTIPIRFEMNLEIADAAAKERGWDPETWAQHAGVSDASIRAFLRGVSTMKRKTVAQILRPLGLTIEELLIDPVKKTPTEPEMMSGSIA